MFTGIIESTGQIREVTTNGTNKTFLIASPLSNELKIDQSLSHNGVCLTIETIGDYQHQVTAILETLRKTTMNSWKSGDFVNLERCMVMNGRLDGHIVQGHVDTIATCVEMFDLKGSREYKFEIPSKFKNLVIEKGSIAIDGVSLTLFDVKKKSFRVAIIPYTFDHTNFKQITPGATVNIEFDIIGKYVNKWRN